jgi:acyl carrier protein
MEVTIIQGKVKDFVESNFIKQDPSIVLNDEDSFLEKQIIDSTGVIELALFIEETFGFRVEDEELVPDNLDSINKLVSYINSKIDRLPINKE